MFLISFLFLSTSDRFIRFLEIIEWFIEWYFSVSFSLLFVFWIAVRWYETVNHYTFAVNLFCWVSSLLIIIVVPHITLCIWAFYGVYIVFYVVIWLVGLTALIGVTYVLACAFKDVPIWVRTSTLHTFVWIAKFTYCVVWILMALLRVSVNIVIGAVIIVYGINDLNLTGASLMMFETLVYFIQGCIFIYIIIGVFENSKIFE